MGKKLTAKRQKFVKCYLSNGMNGAKAAVQAGYSERTARKIANNLLTLVDIQEAISKQQKKETKNLGITRETLLQDIIDIMTDAKNDVQHSVRMKGVELMTKMLGLNEPEKIEVSGTMTETEALF